MTLLQFLSTPNASSSQDLCIVTPSLGTFPLHPTPFPPSPSPAPAFHSASPPPTPPPFFSSKHNSNASWEKTKALSAHDTLRFPPYHISSSRSLAINVYYVNEFHLLGSQGVKKPHCKMNRCPETCISAPRVALSNQHYDFGQVSSHLGTLGDVKESLRALPAPLTVLLLLSARILDFSSPGTHRAWQCDMGAVEVSVNTPNETNLPVPSVVRTRA